jgi:hypothetical protein
LEHEAVRQLVALKVDQCPLTFSRQHIESCEFWNRPNDARRFGWTGSQTKTASRYYDMSIPAVRLSGSKRGLTGQLFERAFGFTNIGLCPAIYGIVVDPYASSAGDKSNSKCIQSLLEDQLPPHSKTFTPPFVFIASMSAIIVGVMSVSASPCLTSCARSSWVALLEKRTFLLPG